MSWLDIGIGHYMYGASPRLVESGPCAGSYIWRLGGPTLVGVGPPGAHSAVQMALLHFVPRKRGSRSTSTLMWRLEQEKLAL